MIRRSLRFALLAGSMVFAAVVVAGCSSETRIEGEVKLDGQPVNGGSISFFPEAEDGRYPVSGEIKDGKYLIDSKRTRIYGSYRVEINWLKETKEEELDKSFDPPKKVFKTVQAIPEQYNKKSKLTAEIKPGLNTYNFTDLKSK